MSGWEKCSQGHDKLELSNQYIHFMPLIFIFSTWNQLELIQLYGSKCWFTCLVSALIWSWELKQTHFKVRLRIEKSWWSIQFFTHIHLCMHHPENQILNLKGGDLPKKFLVDCSVFKYVWAAAVVTCLFSKVKSKLAWEECGRTAKASPWNLPQFLLFVWMCVDEREDSKTRPPSWPFEIFLSYPDIS